MTYKSKFYTTVLKIKNKSIKKIMFLILNLTQTILVIIVPEERGG